MTTPNYQEQLDSYKQHLLAVEKKQLEILDVAKSLIATDHAKRRSELVEHYRLQAALAVFTKYARMDEDEAWDLAVVAADNMQKFIATAMYLVNDV